MEINQSPPQEPIRSRTHPIGWIAHLVLLGAYPLVVGLAPYFLDSEPSGTLLPATRQALLTTAIGEMIIFGLVFLVAWSFSRANSHELLLHWRDGWRPIWRGLGYSILLRIAVAIFMAIVALALMLGAESAEEAMEKMRPRTEVVVDSKALVDDPVYLVLTLTVVSFVVAGLREELWRAGVFAAWFALWPSASRSNTGRWMAIIVTASIFGLGHLPQGWGGAMATAFLGAGLGWVMLRHNSIWEAVLAHGFFNAASFLMLYFLARSGLEL